MTKEGIYAPALLRLSEPGLILTFGDKKAPTIVKKGAFLLKDAAEDYDACFTLTGNYTLTAICGVYIAFVVF